MPIVQFYLVEGAYSDDQIGALLSESSIVYADIFYPELHPRPIERIRAFVHFIKPQHWATGSVLTSEGGKLAPYFTCLALAGRPKEQLHSLLKAVTDLIVRHLGCDAGAVRGQIINIDPDHWSIGGQTASSVRGAEIDKRASG